MCALSTAVWSLCNKKPPYTTSGLLNMGRFIFMKVCSIVEGDAKFLLAILSNKPELECSTS